MLRTIHLPKNQNFKKMVGLKVHVSLIEPICSLQMSYTGSMLGSVDLREHIKNAKTQRHYLK